MYSQQVFMFHERSVYPMIFVALPTCKLTEFFSFRILFYQRKTINQQIHNKFSQILILQKFQ